MVATTTAVPVIVMTIIMATNEATARATLSDLPAKTEVSEVRMGCHDCCSSHCKGPCSWHDVFDSCHTMC